MLKKIWTKWKNESDHFFFTIYRKAFWLASTDIVYVAKLRQLAFVLLVYKKIFLSGKFFKKYFEWKNNEIFSLQWNTGSTKQW